MMKEFKKNGRDFVVRFVDKEVFVGTPACLSDIACQMIVHETMAPLRWKPTGTFMNMTDHTGNFCIGVGYKVPFFKNAEKSVAELFA